MIIKKLSKQTLSAGGVVINSRREVLVVNQRGRSWSLPKGHIKKRESRLNAARREICEESGISDLKFIKSLGAYSRYKLAASGGDDKSELKKIFMFLFRTDKNELKPTDPKITGVKWTEKDYIVDLLTHPKDKKFFLRILKQI